MSLPCPFDIAQVTPKINGCPPDDAYIMFIGGSLPDGIGFSTFGSIKNCIISQVLGGGIVVFNGGQLNGLNEYVDSDWDGFNLIVFYNGVNRVLLYDPNNPTYPNSEYIPLNGGGIRILIPGSYTVADIFVVFPTS